jgi:hypothetical protein
MEKSKRKKLAKRGIRKAYKAMEKIIDNNLIQSKTLKGLTTETTKIELANEYLDKAFNG